MNAHAARRETRALVRNWRRSVFCDDELCGFVHPAENGGWVAEFHGRVLGTFLEERQAVVALLDRQRRSA